MNKWKELITATAILAIVMVAGSARGGLVGHWLMDDTAGSTSAVDTGSLPIGNATIVNNVTLDGTKATFDGVDGDMVTGGTYDVIGNGTADAMTVATWLEWGGLTGLHQTLVSQRDDTVAGEFPWLFTIDKTTGALTYGTRLDINDYSYTLTAGQKVHAAVVYDSGVADLYINGAFEETRNIVIDAYGAGTPEIRIGGIGVANANDPDKEPLNGSLWDVRLYDMALSASEVAAIAVPEPGTLSLLGLSCVGLMLMRRRK